MNIEQKICSSLRKYGRRNQKLVLAYSGGPDSTCLLEVLKKLEYSNVLVAHLNHNLRGEDSQQDYLFAQRKAKRKGYRFVGEEADVKSLAKENGWSLEQAAREARYEFLRRVKDDYGARYIVLAHQRDDQVETIVLNFLRGAGPKGLAGMQEQAGDLLRPMLGVSKQVVLDYLRERRLTFRVDQSNFDKKFKRNYVRLEVIPNLQQANENFSETVLRQAAYFRQMQDRLEQEAKSFLRGGFLLKDFLDMSDLLKGEVLRQKYLQAHGDLNNFTSAQVEEILKVLIKKRNGLKKEFGPGCFIVVRKPKVVVEKVKLDK